MNTKIHALSVLAGVVFTLTGCATSHYIPGEPKPGEFSLASLNVHYLVPDNDRTGWENRKHALTAALREIDPDIVLFQEMETFKGGHAPDSNIQLDWVTATVEGYAVGAVGDPEVFPITQPILFSTDKFTLVDQGFFFFSDTPDVIYADPWKGGWPAYTTWVRLQDRRDGRNFYVFNTHLDAFSRKNRTKGTALILERIASREDLDAPMVLAGDFNALKGSKIIGDLESAGLTRVPADGASYHFGSGTHLYGAIDHMLYTSGVRTTEAGIVQQQWEGEWPSDHHPVYAVFRWDS